MISRIHLSLPNEYNFIADQQKMHSSVPIATIKFPLTSLQIAESSETRLSFLTGKNLSLRRTVFSRICFCMFLHQAQWMHNFIADQQKKNA